MTICFANDTGRGADDGRRQCGADNVPGRGGRNGPQKIDEYIGDATEAAERAEREAVDLRGQRPGRRWGKHGNENKFP